MHIDDKSVFLFNVLVHVYIHFVYIVRSFMVGVGDVLVHVLVHVYCVIYFK